MQFLAEDLGVGTVSRGTLGRHSSHPCDVVRIGVALIARQIVFFRIQFHQGHPVTGHLLVRHSFFNLSVVLIHEVIVLVHRQAGGEGLHGDQTGSVGLCRCSRPGAVLVLLVEVVDREGHTLDHDHILAQGSVCIGMGGGGCGLGSGGYVMVVSQTCAHRKHIGRCITRKSRAVMLRFDGAICIPIGGFQPVAGAVVGVIGQLTKVGCRLDDRLDLRVSIEIVRTQVLDHIAVLVVVHRQHQAVEALVLVVTLVFIDVFGIILDIYVFIANQFIPVIVLTGNVDAHEVVVILALLLQANGEDHLLLTVLIAVKVARCHRLNMGVADDGMLGSIVVVVEVGDTVHRGLGAAATHVIDPPADKEQLSGAHAAKGHGLSHDFTPAAVITAVEAADPPAVGVHIVGAGGHQFYVALAVHRGKDPLHIPVLVIDGDLAVHLGAILDPSRCTGAHHKEVGHAVAVEVTAHQAGRCGEGMDAVIVGVLIPDVAHIGSGLAHRRLACPALGSVDHLEGGLVAVQGYIRGPHSMAIGEDRQVIDPVAVQVADRHGNRQLIGRVSVRPIDGAAEISRHQQTFGLRLLGQGFFAGIVGEFGEHIVVPTVGHIDHEGVLAVAVKVTGYDVKEGGALELVVVVVHPGDLSQVVDLTHGLAVLQAGDPHLSVLSVHTNEGCVVVPTICVGAEGRGLDEGPGSVGEIEIPGAGAVPRVLHKVLQASPVGVLQAGVLAAVGAAEKEQLMGGVQVEGLSHREAVGILVCHIPGGDFPVLLQNGSACAGRRGRNQRAETQQQGQNDHTAEDSFGSDVHKITSSQIRDGFCVQI